MDDVNARIFTFAQALRALLHQHFYFIRFYGDVFRQVDRILFGDQDVVFHLDTLLKRKILDARRNQL